MRLEEREMDICEYLEHPFENALLLDVRSKTMFSFGSLPDAVNLPVDEIGSLEDALYYAASCAGDPNLDAWGISAYPRAQGTLEMLLERLLDAGYDAYHLAGGYREYIQKVIGPTLHEESSEEVSE